MLAVIAVSGDITRNSFTYACMAAGIHQRNWDDLTSLREKGLLNKHSLRAAGDNYDRFTALDSNGTVSLSNFGHSDTINVNTHPLTVTSDE